MSPKKPKFIYRVLTSIDTITFIYLPILSQSTSSGEDSMLLASAFIPSLILGFITKRVKKEKITHNNMRVILIAVLSLSILFNLAFFVSQGNINNKLFLPPILLSLNFPIFVLTILMGAPKFGITLILGSYFCFIAGLISAYGVKDNILKTSPSIRNLFLFLTLSMMVMMSYFNNFGIHS